MAALKPWQNHAVYQIYPRSFCDSNGDGVGDIPGIISKLDYLKSLGVGILWLSPIYCSPNDDMGYDVSDYKAINPEYGTMADFDRLILEAKKRDLRIVMDLVVNHTSDEHAWFKESKKPDSPYRDYYYWREGKKNNTLPPNNWTSMFPGSAWEFVPEVGLWYLHLYGKKQPDLNWHNPKVKDEVESILRFWLDKGVYGFRCDVIDQIYKESLEDGKGLAPSGRGIEHYLMTEGNHKILQELQADVFSHYDCVVIGETFKVDIPNGQRFLNGEMAMFFQFDAMETDKWWNPFWAKRFKAKKFMAILYRWQKGVDWNANYLENHDQRRSISRFGDPRHYWKESGKMLGLLNFTLRGTPFIYEGEELGMLNYPYKEKPGEYKDVCCDFLAATFKKFHFPKHLAIKFIDVYNRDHARSPMQWDSTPNAGFSKTSGPCWLPLNPNYPNLNARLESLDSHSILAFYQKLTQLRLEHSALNLGSIVPLKGTSYVFAYRRQDEKESLLVLLNFSKKNRRIPQRLRPDGGTLLLSDYDDTSLTNLKKLRPFEALVLVEK
jgi:oligo-1,6-glucosidase